MPRPVPTPVLHFTHVENLPSIVRDGLRPDSVVGGVLSVEVGNRGIKDQRRERHVPVGDRGRVCEYVPFYFAPRSPMLSAIHHGRVPGYTSGTEPLVYLVTSVEGLLATGLRPVFTDRNAVLALAQFSDRLTDLDDLVDWPLMRERYWSNTPDDPERRERRMAECLVPGLVPWAAIELVVTRSVEIAEVARRVASSLEHSVSVDVRPGWYF